MKKIIIITIIKIEGDYHLKIIIIIKKYNPNFYEENDSSSENNL